jgi:hypothetical protein
MQNLEFCYRNSLWWDWKSLEIWKCLQDSYLGVKERAALLPNSGKNISIARHNVFAKLSRQLGIRGGRRAVS